METTRVLSSSLTLEESLQRMSDAIYELVQRVSRFEDFISNETVGIEQEIAAKVKLTLQELYPGFRILEPLKMFPEMEYFYVPNGAATITQFDGLYIVTSDPTFDLPEHRLDLTKTSDSKTVLIIVEAKHALTGKQCRWKIEQVVKIQDAFQLARDIDNGVTDPSTVTPSFLARMNTFRYSDFSPEILLFVGGPQIKLGTVDFLRSVGKSLWLDPKPFMISQTRTVNQVFPIRTSIVYPHGHRYVAADVSDDFEE